MDFVVRLNRFIALFVDSLKQFGRGRLWLILLSYFLLNWLVLYAHYDFVSPLFYGVVKAWTELFGKQQAVGFTHYPGHFLLLPYFFGWAKFYLGLLVEGAVLGAIAVIFYDAFLDTPKEERIPLKSLFPLWIHLVLGWVLINGVVLLINIELPRLLEPWLAGSPRRIKVFEYLLLPGLYMFVLALWYYTIPRIAIYREKFHRAVAGSLRMFFRRPITTLFLAFFVSFIPIYLSVITSKTGEIVDKFKPELVYWLLLVGLVADMFFFFFWMGTSVRFLLEEEEEE